MSRERSRILSDTYRDFVVDFEIGGEDAVYGPVHSAYGQDSMIDTVTPNYHKRIAQGEIINSPCKYEKSERISPEMGYCRYVQDGLQVIYSHTGDISAVRQVSVGNLHSSLVHSLGENGPYAARSKLLAIANIDTTPYAFGEDAGEIGETLRFLRHPLESVLKVVRTFWKAKNSRSGLGYQDFEKQARALADLWMTYSFAAAPLVRSLTDALEAYSEKPETLPERLTARGFDKPSEKLSGQFDNGTYVFDITSDLEYDNHASILYTVSNPITDMRYRLGFRPKDFPTTMWQLMPLSFMVDRVVDVSHFLQAVINLYDPKVTILAASHRVKTNSETSFRLVEHNVSGWTNSPAGELVTDKTFSYVRNPWSPSFSDTVPNASLEHLKDSATKMLDLTSLILKFVR